MRPFRAGCFACLYAVGRGLELGAKVILHAAAGLARLEDLRAAIRAEWDEDESLLTRGHATSGLMDWEQAFYPRFLRPSDRILLIGCGSGRELLALLEQGYRVEGLDLAGRSLEVARRLLTERGLTAPLHAGSIETAPLSGSFDAFIFSWFSYGYIPHSHARVAVLVRLQRHLARDGRILVSYPPYDRPPSALAVRLTRFVTRMSRSDWRPEYGDMFTVLRPGRYFGHFVHQFASEEIEAETQRSGLAVLFHERRRDEGLIALSASAHVSPMTKSP